MRSGRSNHRRHLRRQRPRSTHSVIIIGTLAAHAAIDIQDRTAIDEYVPDCAAVIFTGDPPVPPQRAVIAAARAVATDAAMDIQRRARERDVAGTQCIDVNRTTVPAIRAVTIAKTVAARAAIGGQLAAGQRNGAVGRRQGDHVAVASIPAISEAGMTARAAIDADPSTGHVDAAKTSQGNDAAESAATAGDTVTAGNTRQRRPRHSTAHCPAAACHSRHAA